MQHSRPPYWALARQALDALVEAGPQGLSSSQAAERLRRSGPNVVAQDESAAAWRLLVRQVANPLVLILLLGAGLSMVLREWVDASIILAVVVGSALLGFHQEYRASTALAALRQRLALNALVFRDKAWTTIPAAALVPGDLIRLSAGNLVPADAVVLEARDFLVAEAALTGESFPVEKRPGAVAADTPVARRSNCVFLGTSVRSGSATALVVETGRQTELGAIAGRLALAGEETEFTRGLRQFGYLLSRVMIVVALFVLTVNVLMHRPPVDSLLFAVALAIGLSPELLPATVSVTLSAGARRLAGLGVLVRRLEAIENLGSIDILCTDKTGTLTMGDVALSDAIDPLGAPSEEVLRLAVVNAALETGIANPLDAAIVAAGKAAGVDTRGEAKLDEIPYDFIRKRLSIVIEQAGAGNGSALIVMKGAVPNVLECCSKLRGARGASAPLDAAAIEEIDRLCEGKAREGYRVLAVATRAIERRTAYDRHDESEMTLEGLLLFRDPLKPGIAETIQELRKIGISVKIVSGDNRHTAAHVGAAIGLDPARTLTGEDLAAMKEEALWHLAETTEIFAEVDPQQKERIVRALQKRGHAVGYMGDGINDAPPMLAADVGISVDRAVDVARESADVVLLRPDLDVLRTGVLDGRRSFENTLKYIKITVSANFGNMISMALATMFLPFMPLAAKQILLNNLLSDIPSLAISTDDVDHQALETAQRWSMPEVTSFMLVFGLISTLFDGLTFVLLLNVFKADEPMFQSAWFVVSLLTELIVLLILRTRLPAWQSRPSRFLLYATAAVAAVAIVLPYLGGLARIFGLVPIPLAVMAAMAAVVFAYAATTEAAKLWRLDRRVMAPKS